MGRRDRDVGAVKDAATMSNSPNLIRPLEENAGSSALIPRTFKELVMGSANKVKPIPDGMHSITPHLVCDGAAAAIEFYKKAFGATELARMPGPDGRLMHAQVNIGDS